MTKKAQEHSINQPPLNFTEEQYAAVDRMVDEGLANYYDARRYVLGDQANMPEGLLDHMIEAEDLAG